ncbi:phosphoribosylformylglycinamidine synthase [Kaistella flava (ex Peng et al. 2021)]|uniref:Phosphoribosylformylglycinamidine synthase n=1 Tax=Kaistella flava (ex Peng et al. 2021) TaxID=2038776 RepID=A0A7M2Y5E0_9FLAO|nr:HAEPLYID family protein [Kaistella flava (ex Peng et al. 2021)]QOW09316.1 phosphoribosylformylglycinamidine synthase [Kaistella flava (ex Peng et al. 2021)]
MENRVKVSGNLILLVLLFCSIATNAQEQPISNPPVKIPKVHHIEPLYIDLVRDLGARKGEKELNLAGDFKNTSDYSEYGVLAEYEFAPIDRLGLEVETDFSFFKRISDAQVIPKNRFDNLRLSAQYSFYVSPKYNTTLAIGYTQVFGFTAFEDLDDKPLIKGLQYCPFFIAAKRWGSSIHTLIFAGPIFKHRFNTDYTNVDWQINTSIDYAIPNSSNFVGIEFNKEIVDGKFEMTMRPQGKIQINKALALGLVAGFPITKSKEKFSSFFRLIYEL